MERVREIEGEVDAEIERLRARAEERDEQGRLTKAAKDIRQSLHNPDLVTTTIPVALKAMSKTRVRLLREAHEAHVALEQTCAKYATALAALRWHDLKRELFEQDAPRPRKHVLAASEISEEELTFLREMRRRGVPSSAMDQGNIYERDFIALFLKELAKPIDKRGPGGAWARTFAEGELTMPVHSMTDDQIEALRIVYDPARDTGIEAKRVLEAAAGRELDISLNFAMMLIAINEQIDLDELPGLKKNIDTAERLAWKRDVAKILDQLGLNASDIERARAILAGPPAEAAASTAPGPHALAEPLASAQPGAPPAGPPASAEPPASAVSDCSISTTEMSQAAVDQYQTLAREIVDKRMADLWIAIGLPSAPDDIYVLELAAVDALRAGVQVDYLEEIADRASYSPNVAFIDELIKRESRLLAARLTEDPDFRKQMQYAGFFDGARGGTSALPMQT
ncbi:hypothetical protein [Pseudorhodoplanes sp.]|uniref:hypothetical protein n=1 Tax=Pseudorhodoplanes sp. TaxID=1934341 RepID=UPI001237557D|nr:hypothetical protein [Pseudorhodoplanes sp.]HWK67130.1 hypothetical protein [Rhizobiaceae bacterium]HWV52980.1 hypothetical protein [Pseudorhodoplanes sp.]